MLVIPYSQGDLFLMCITCVGCSTTFLLQFLHPLNKIHVTLSLVIGFFLRPQIGMPRYLRLVCSIYPNS
jgi:hypothetical protein